MEVGCELVSYPENSVSKREEIRFQNARKFGFKPRLSHIDIFAIKSSIKEHSFSTNKNKNLLIQIMKSTIFACLLSLFSLVAASHVEPQTIPVKHTHESKIQNPSIEEKAELTEESLPQLPEEKTEDLTEEALPSFPVACFPNGAMRCDGLGFLTCVWGKWVKRY